MAVLHLFNGAFNDSSGIFLPVVAILPIIISLGGFVSSLGYRAESLFLPVSLFLPAREVESVSVDGTPLLEGQRFCFTRVLVVGGLCVGTVSTIVGLGRVVGLKVGPGLQYERITLFVGTTGLFFGSVRLVGVSVDVLGAPVRYTKFGTYCLYGRTRRRHVLDCVGQRTRQGVTETLVRPTVGVAIYGVPFATPGTTQGRDHIGVVILPRHRGRAPILEIIFGLVCWVLDRLGFVCCMTMDDTSDINGFPTRLFNSLLFGGVSIFVKRRLNNVPDTIVIYFPLVPGIGVTLARPSCVV